MRHVTALWLLVLTAGCQSTIASKQSVGGQSSHAGGNANAGGDSQNGGTSGAQTAVQPSEALMLTSASAHVDGRRGNRVRLSIAGTQQPHSLASVAVTALDSNGNAIYWYSTKHDDRFDSPTGYLVPTSLPQDSQLQFELLVPMTNALLDWQQARISLVDRADAISNEVTVPIEKQSVKNKGDACDPAAKLDRCDARLDCSSASNTCVDHAGPTLTQVGYFTTGNGPLIVASGADNADDLKQVEIAFFDGNGAPVQVNLNNDTTNPLMASNFVETAGISNLDGQIGFRISPTETFTDLVKAISLIPVDTAGKRGEAITAALQQQPSRGSGMSCDVYGYDFCSGNSACLPGLAGAANTCQPITTAQFTACASAPVVDLSQNQLVITGYNVGASLWEPAVGCVPEVGLNHPETVIKLHVPSAVNLLTLSTDRRETLIDTVVYVVSECGKASPSVLGCNDDVASGTVASAVKLTDVAPGDYYVVVDSISSDGGQFALAVSAQ